MLSLHNTLSKEKEELKPIHKDEVRMYNCGPTVYWDVHSGNLRMYIAWDVLARYIRWSGQDLRRIMNFTDVGHMTTDDNFGEDKIEKQAKQEQKDPLDIANKYIVNVLKDFAKINILHPNGEKINEKITVSEIEKRSKVEWAKLGWTRATDYIQEMVEIIKLIEKHGLTYETNQALYFDVTKYDDYTRLSGQSLEEKSKAVREEVVIDPDKKHAADFVLWMKRKGKYKNHIMHWDSPWGDGFPGWHIECSAMASNYLGERIDIHTGGVDHIGVHHTNERAQNYGAFGQDGANMWVHGEMVVDKEGKKASKSKKNVYFLHEIEEKGYSAMDLRYYFLTINYSKPIAFSFEGLEGAKNSRINLIKRLYALNQAITDDSQGEGVVLTEFTDRFKEVMDDNLNTSAVFAIINELIDADHKAEDILATVYNMDQVLGLGLELEVSEYEDFLEKKRSKIDEDLVERLVVERERAREEQNFTHADEIRDKLFDMGVVLEDTDDGTVWRIE